MPIHTIHIYSSCYLQVVTSRQVSVCNGARICFSRITHATSAAHDHRYTLFLVLLLLPLPKVHLLPNDTFIMAKFFNSTVKECMSPLLSTVNSRNGHMQGSLFAAFTGNFLPRRAISGTKF